MLSSVKPNRPERIRLEMEIKAKRVTHREEVCRLAWGDQKSICDGEPPPPPVSGWDSTTRNEQIHIMETKLLEFQKNKKMEFTLIQNCI